MRRSGSAAEAGSFALGSLGAFLVIEARDYAETRGAKPLARLSAVLSDRSNARRAPSSPALARLWGKIKDKSRQVTPRCCRAPPAPSRRPRKNGPFWRPMAILPSAPPVHISGMGWSRNFP